MRKLGFLLWVVQGLVAQAASSPCDLNSDGTVNTADVQLSINQSLGLSPCTADLNGDGRCDVMDVQRVITAALGGTCNAVSGLNPPVTVSLTPSTASLTPSQLQQFTATVSGTANQTVNWSLTPAIGTLSTTGLYSAPAVATAQTVTVTAKSVADPTKSASALVSLSAPLTSFTYYVDSANGSDSNPGTQALPWATLNRAVTTLAAGQAAYLKDGTYGTDQLQRLDWRGNGTSTAPITITAAPGCHPVIKELITMTGTYLRLTNLIIDKNTYPTNSRPGARPPQTGGQPGGNVGVWLNSCNYCTLEGNEIRNTTMSGVFVSNSSNVTITRNYIHDLGTTSDDHGVYYHDGGSGSVISNNLIVRAYDYGIQLYPSPNGLLVVNNTISESGTSGLTGGGGSGIVVAGTNITVVNNIIVGNLNGAICQIYGTGNLATHNLVWNNGSSSYCAGLMLDGPPNSNANPLFVAAGDFDLSSSSPAIGYADRTYLPAVDLNDRSRIRSPDAGALEYYGNQ